ncbi:MAG: universal stress protein [Armatimonadota bacterium]|jgi:nucleotide-binding universal stress UspA family protein
MYNKILVPLDESEIAETALQHAAAIAEAFKSELVLLSVIEPVTILPEPGVVGPVLTVSVDVETEMKHAKSYLSKHASKLREQGIKVRTEVVEGMPAGQICQYVQEKNIELIVMTTHGRSGLSRLVYGSVAENILRNAKIPVLLIRIHRGSQS